MDTITSSYTAEDWDQIAGNLSEGELQARIRKLVDDAPEWDSKIELDMLPDEAEQVEKAIKDGNIELSVYAA